MILKEDSQLRCMTMVASSSGQHSVKLLANGILRTVISTEGLGCTMVDYSAKEHGDRPYLEYKKEDEITVEAHEGEPLSVTVVFSALESKNIKVEVLPLA